MNLTGRPIYKKGAKPVVSKPLRSASRNKSCTLRIPGVCTNDNAQTVGCHLRLFNTAGAAQKPSDLHMIDACGACHAVLDSRDKWASSGVGYDDLLRALIETQNRRVAEGKIIMAGAA